MSQVKSSPISESRVEMCPVMFGRVEKSRETRRCMCLVDQRVE